MAPRTHIRDLPPGKPGSDRRTGFDSRPILSPSLQAAGSCCHRVATRQAADRLPLRLVIRRKTRAAAHVLCYTQSRWEGRMRTKRFSRIQWLLVGGSALALAAPAVAGAKGYPNLVQIGGELVPPAQVSEWQATADLPRIPNVVQIGGDLVAPSQVSNWQANADLPQIPGVVQMGGELVVPSQLSAWQREVGAAQSSS